MPTNRTLAAYRIDNDLLEGMEVLWERDGIQPSEQVRRAIRWWLEAKGVIKKATAPRRAGTRRKA
jgi:hypothetical protein